MVTEGFLKVAAGPGRNNDGIFTWGQLFPVLLGQTLLERFDNLIFEAAEHLEYGLSVHGVDMLLFEVRSAKRSDKIIPFCTGVASNLILRCSFMLAGSKFWFLFSFRLELSINIVEEIQEIECLGFSLIE